MNSSLQIQSVIYHNEKEALFRAMDSISNAIRISRKRDHEIGDVTLCYGDASKEPVFTEKEVSDISTRYQEWFSFRYTFFGENTGTAKGHNRLGENCEAEYMMIMNPDVLLSPHFFRAIMRPFHDSSLNAGLVEARQTPIEHPKDYDIKTGETGWATTACAVFPTEIFQQIGGFDAESFFMYCDDLDFSWRIRLLGKKIIYQPLAPVFHAKRLSATGAWKPTAAEVYYSAEAALFLAYKWSANKRCEELVSQFSGSQDENLKKAADTFLKRKAEGSLPDQIDKNHKVAEFHGNYYCKHRFVL